MNRYKLIIIFACLSLALSAQDGYLNINRNDKSGFATSLANVDSMWIGPDNASVLIGVNGKQTARFSIGSTQDITIGSKSYWAIDSIGRNSISKTISDYTIRDYTQVAEPGYDEDAIDASDYYDDFGTKNAATFTITYNGNTASLDKTNISSDVKITMDGAHVTIITKKKTKLYLKGETHDGSLNILTTNGDTDNKKLWIVLSNVSITNPNGPALNIQSSKSVYLQLGKNTSNTLQDGATYTAQTGIDQKGTLFSEGQLLFHGSGSLTVNSLGGHGICSDDYIRFRADLGTININSFKDGINTKDKFIMYGGNLGITSSSDGITVRRGKISIYGGQININSVDDGLVSDYTGPDTAGIVIAGGYAKITTTGPKGHAVSTTGKLTVTGGAIETDVIGNASKCISATSDITILGGKFKLTAKGTSIYDDEEKEFSSAAGIRTRSNLFITNGEITILSTGDGSKGINTDGTTTITGGTIYIENKGATYTNNDNTVNARAFDSSSLVISQTPALYLGAATTSMHITTDLIMDGGTVYSYSDSDQSKSLNVKGNILQTQGLLFYGKSE